VACHHAAAASRAREAIPPGLNEQEFDTWLRAIDPETSALRAERLKLQVLVVEQGRRSDLIAGVALGEHGCKVVWTPAERLERALTEGEGFDVVVLDQAVPRRQARFLEQMCKDHLASPILIRTDLAEFETLITRVTSLPYRAVSGEVIGAVSAGNLQLDLVTRTLIYGDLKLTLTRSESHLLTYLKQNTDILISHKMLFRAVWGYIYTHRCELVHLHVKRLQAKIHWEYSGCRLYAVEDLGFVLMRSE